MLLEDKVAVIYGAGGTIGRGVARGFVREGARVYLAGRTSGPLDVLADELRAAGGAAETVVVDALDEQAVDTFVDSVADQAGAIDISFNLIGLGDVQKPLSEISVDDFEQPVRTAVRTHFLTTRAAARHMVPRQSGVVMLFGGGGPQTTPGLGGFKVALDAMEGLRRQWASELGPQGIRVVTLKSGGVPESIPESLPGGNEIVASLEAAARLPRLATLDDVGNVAAFVASDRAQTITDTDINISCGAIVD